MASKAVCLISGGLDSCVAAAEARCRGFDLAFLHLSYGQRTQRREKQAFQEIAAHFGIEELLTGDLEFLGRMGGSALTDAAIAIPEGLAPHREEIPISYVPFRNANLLSVASSWAEVLGAVSVFIGAVQEDGSGYPDCRRSFIDAFNALLREGTRPETRVQVEAPLLHLRKGEIVKRGLELQAPLDLTWSCYQAEDLACGLCDSCQLRLEGFQAAGAEDPIPYAIREPQVG